MKGWLSAAAFASVAFAAAVPAGQLDAKSLLKRVVSPDGTCGGSAGYTCSTSSYKCCSQWGWCGDSDEHCGEGCQSAYGTCSGSGTPTTTTTVPSTPGTTAPPTTTGRAKPGNVPYGVFVSTCSLPGYVALTFDDGPYIFTSSLLNILSSNSVAATFFVNGQNWGADNIYSAEKSALVKRMIAEGHQVGSHTWSHPDLSTLSNSDVSTQMTQLETAFMSIIGKAPTYMRPPYFSCGAACLSVMNQLGYHVIHSNLDTLDWQYNTDATIQSSKNIFANAINSASTGSTSFIPLAHDVHSTTVNSLVQYMITTLKAKGFKTATVGQCMGDPAANWYRTV